MSSTTLTLTDEIHHYLQKMSLRESETLVALREKTRTMTGAIMQITPEQGQFMALLVATLRAKLTIDIGTYTGYSALVVAEALPDDGKVISCDVSTEAPEIAKTFWRQAGVQNKIDLRIAPALDTLKSLLVNYSDQVDFIFIDADKSNIKAYYELSLQLLRQGGIIAVDNVLWSGAVVDKNDQSSQTCAIREFNEHILNDHRVRLSMLPIGDGLTLAYKA